MVYKMLDIKFGLLTDKSDKGGGANNEIKQNEQLVEELHKPTIKRLKKNKSIFFI